jgi:hypothetical protein
VPNNEIVDYDVPETDWPIGDRIDSIEVSYYEVGLAAMHLCHAATNLGYYTGFCACMPNFEELAEYIGYEDSSTVLAMGIGSIPEGLTRQSSDFFCPIDQKWYKRGLHWNQPRPEIGKFIKYHTD